MRPWRSPSAVDTIMAIYELHTLHTGPPSPQRTGPSAGH